MNPLTSSVLILFRRIQKHNELPGVSQQLIWSKIEGMTD